MKSFCREKSQARNEDVPKDKTNSLKFCVVIVGAKASLIIKTNKSKLH
ncbi:hypothetical protein LINPERPRIM_LOCUS34464 [Linum perenne]